VRGIESAAELPLIWSACSADRLDSERMTSSPFLESM